MPTKKSGNDGAQFYQIPVTILVMNKKSMLKISILHLTFVAMPLFPIVPLNTPIVNNGPLILCLKDGKVFTMTTNGPLFNKVLTNNALAGWKVCVLKGTNIVVLMKEATGRYHTNLPRPSDPHPSQFSKNTGTPSQAKVGRDIDPGAVAVWI